VTADRRLGSIKIATYTLAIAIIAVFLFKIPTLDFDESLYRSVSDSMKHAHNPWYLAWDGKALFHKPPVFYWLIWFFSNLIDRSNAPVSTLACRMPSLFATIGILICLRRSGKRFLSDGDEIGHSASLAFLCGLFPVLTATSVLFDPLQTLLLMPALIVPTVLFFDENKIRTSDWIGWSLSLFAASALKGLNGIVVPTFAFGIHALFFIRPLGYKKVLSLALRFLLRVFLPACALIAIYFYALNEKIGPEFTHEFIWVQHFERGTIAKEQHSGTFFYQLFVLFFGGGILIPLLFERLGNLKLIFRKFGFPLTYALSVVIVFGLSATKLPHYSWPAWPALCLFIGLIPATSLQTKKYSTELRMLAVIPVLLVGIFSLSLALFPTTLLGLFAKTPSFLGVMKYFSGFTFLESIAFLTSAILCFAFIAKKNAILPHIEVCALISLGVSLSLSLGFARTLDSLMVTPFYQIATSVKNDGAGSQDCIRYSGALSPTLSLALAPELLHNRCEPGAMRYLIAPEWKKKECDERSFKVIDQKSYLVLCKKG
jgi:4-amino-4-deoxy-L-arabinose transferase-like glycosyltransferase